jgi:hypothetical protein
MSGDIFATIVRAFFHIDGRFYRRQIQAAAEFAADMGAIGFRAFSIVNKGAVGTFEAPIKWAEHSDSFLECSGLIK